MKRLILICVFCFSGCLPFSETNELLFGSWMDSSNNTIISFYEDGTVIFDDCIIGSWSIADRLIEFEFPEQLELVKKWTVGGINEQTVQIVKSNGFEYHLTRVADFDRTECDLDDE